MQQLKYDKLHVYLYNFTYIFIYIYIYTLYGNVLHSLMSVIHIYYFNLVLVQFDFENHCTHFRTLFRTNMVQCPLCHNAAQCGFLSSSQPVLPL